MGVGREPKVANVAARGRLRRLVVFAFVFAAVAAGVPMRASAAEEATPVVRFHVDRFVVEGDNPLSPAETSEVLHSFTGEHAGLEGLLAAADALQQAISRRGYAFRSVILPPQTLQAGVVTLKVVALPLGRVNVAGNLYFSTENILASLPGLSIGAVPDPKELSREVALANEHPSKKVAVTFKESESADALEANVRVDDQKPWQLFFTANNTSFNFKNNS